MRSREPRNIGPDHQQRAGAAREHPRRGVSAVSQTAGPETVLCGELEIPFALIGFVTDYANEVRPGDPTPVSTLIDLMALSTGVFADVLGGAVANLVDEPAALAGTVYRFAQE